MLLPTPSHSLFWRGLLRLVFKVFYRFEATGQENLPEAGPLILASNHQSYFDPALVAIGQNHPVVFMTWSALFRGWFGRLIRRYGAFPVDLERPDPKAYQTALASLRAGQWLVIFPEGGRTEDGKLLELREGVARLALHTGAPIVPVRIEGAFEVWPKPRPRPHLFGRIKLTYGPPIEPPRQKGDSQARNEAARRIMDELHGFLNGEHTLPAPSNNPKNNMPGSNVIG